MRKVEDLIARVTRKSNQQNQVTFNPLAIGVRNMEGTQLLPSKSFTEKEKHE